MLPPGSEKTSLVCEMLDKQVREDLQQAVLDQIEDFIEKK